MTSLQAMHALETILDMLERLLPGFHTLSDRADLTEARLAIKDVLARLERDMAEQAKGLEEAP